MKMGEILGLLVGKFVQRLPYSLLLKLSDGKMTKEELNMLKDELVSDVISVFQDLAAKAK